MRQRFPWLSKAARLLSLAAVVSANVPLAAQAAAVERMDEVLTAVKALTPCPPKI
jgi:hypothetical protein